MIEYLSHRNKLMEGACNKVFCQIHTIYWQTHLYQNQNQVWFWNISVSELNIDWSCITTNIIMSYKICWLSKYCNWSVLQLFNVKYGCSHCLQSGEHFVVGVGVGEFMRAYPYVQYAWAIVAQPVNCHSENTYCMLSNVCCRKLLRLFVFVGKLDLPQFEILGSRILLQSLKFLHMSLPLMCFIMSSSIHYSSPAA